MWGYETYLQHKGVNNSFSHIVGYVIWAYRQLQGGCFDVPELKKGVAIRYSLLKTTFPKWKYDKFMGGRILRRYFNEKME